MERKAAGPGKKKPLRAISELDLMIAPGRPRLSNADQLESSLH